MTFEEFAATRLPGVLRFAGVLTADRALAEDVVQEVLIRVHARWNRIDAMDRPELYVRKMIVNEFVSWRRRSWRLVPSGRVPDAGDRVSQDHAFAHAERAALLAELGKLPRRQRAVLALRYYEGLSDTEIAEVNYGAGSIGNPIFPYDKLGSLPRNPAKLNAYFRSLDPVKSDNTSSVEFSQIEQMLFGMVLPPSLKAEMFHALALIPLIQVKDHVKDIAGRPGVAFVLPPTRNNLKLEIILDASSYQLLAQGSWDNPRLPAPDSETAILREYLVAELGSTQASAAPPSAAELAAERINLFQEHLSNPSEISNLASGQWLYRDLRTDGKDRQIWATADDSAQAQYVSGTLHVCKRADPCAASEQWLMPPRPSYALADVPGVSVQHITDAAGQKDIAFTFPARDGATAILINARQLNAGTIQYEGYVRGGQQTLVLDQALVSGPGVRP